MKEKVKAKHLCEECKKRVAKFECWCGNEFCGECSENGEWCPQDEQIEHFVKPIK